MDFKMSPVPDGSKRYRVFVDGTAVDARLVRIESDRFEAVEYGLRPEGYDGCVIYERGGGGAATIPWTVHDGELYVGLVKESRANIFGTWYDVCGGYVEPGQTHAGAALKRAATEAGIPTDAPRDELPGVAVSSNRTYWVADPAKGEGIHFFAVRVPETDVELDPDADQVTALRFVATHRSVTLAKAPERFRFFPWRDAVQESPCGIALAGIARLLAEVGAVTVR